MSENQKTDLPHDKQDQSEEINESPGKQEPIRTTVRLPAWIKDWLESRKKESGDEKFVANQFIIQSLIAAIEQEGEHATRQNHPPAELIINYDFGLLALRAIYLLLMNAKHGSEANRKASESLAAEIDKFLRNAIQTRIEHNDSKP